MSRTSLYKLLTELISYTSAYALLDNRIEHRSFSEYDSSDHHSDGTVCASCCDAFQNSMYPSSVTKYKQRLCFVDIHQTHDMIFPSITDDACHISDNKIAWSHHKNKM